MQVWSRVWEEPLEKEMATHSSIIAWKTPWTEKPGRLPGIAKSWTTQQVWWRQLLYDHLQKESTVVRFNETGSRMMVARGCVEGEEGLLGTGFWFVKMENFRRWVVVMVTPIMWLYYYFLIKKPLLKKKQKQPFSLFFSLRWYTCFLLIIFLLLLTAQGRHPD